MAIYSFILPFHEANFCGVLSYVFAKLGCTAGEKIFRNIELRPRQFPSISCPIYYSWTTLSKVSVKELNFY